MIKKTYEIIVALDDYGDDAYDANLYPFEAYDNLDNNEKITMLYAIKDLIESEIFNIEQTPL